MTRTSKKALARYIKERRMALGMTQEELAERLHVSRDVVSAWERGLRYPDYEILDDLSVALGVTVQELYDGSKEILRPSAVGANIAAIALVVTAFVVGGVILGNNLQKKQMDGMKFTGSNVAATTVAGIEGIISESQAHHDGSAGGDSGIETGTPETKDGRSEIESVATETQTSMEETQAPIILDFTKVPEGIRTALAGQADVHFVEEYEWELYGIEPWEGELTCTVPQLIERIDNQADVFPMYGQISFGVADFDRDGIDEVVIQAANQYVYILHEIEGDVYAYGIAMRGDWSIYENGTMTSLSGQSNFMMNHIVGFDRDTFAFECIASSNMGTFYRGEAIWNQDTNAYATENEIGMEEYEQITDAYRAAIIVVAPYAPETVEDYMEY